jgi:hypothetical protein
MAGASLRMIVSERRSGVNPLAIPHMGRSTPQDGTTQRTGHTFFGFPSRHPRQRAPGDTAEPATSTERDQGRDDFREATTDRPMSRAQLETESGRRDCREAGKRSAIS